MATRKSSAEIPMINNLANPDDSANEWAITESDALSVTWSNPTSNEKIKLPVGARPTEHIVAIARMNGAVLTASPEPDDFFNDESFPEDLEEPTPIERLVTMLRDETGSERSEVKIYRMREGKPDSYCGSFKPEEFEKQNLELIRSHYGPGKYRVKIYGTKPGTNLYVIRMNQTVEIEASLIPTSTVSSAPDKVDLLMQRLDAMQNQQSSGMGSMKEMLQMFVMMKQAFGDSGQQRSQIGEIVGAIRELREVSGELGTGNNNGNSGTPDLMGMGAEVLKLIAANQAAQPVSPQVYASNPVEPFPIINAAPSPIQHVAPVDEIINNQESEQTEMSPFVKIMFSAILKKAKAGAPVEPIAADLYPRLPDQILDSLETEMWFDLLQEFHPGVKEHEAWFTALRSALLAEIAKDESGE